jgi:hypothetical protein
LGNIFEMTARAGRATPSAKAWLCALVQPWTLAVPLIGYAVAILVATLPAFSSYSRGWMLLIIITVICQVLLVVAEVRGRRQDSPVPDVDPMLAEVSEVRTRIGQKIAALPGDALKSGLPALLTRLDQEILPELRRLIGKHQQLGQELRAYRGERRGRLRPSATTLRELENLYARQQGVIEGVVQQVVDLDASLSGLVQEGDERGIMASVQEWNARISERWRALREMGTEG